MRYCLIKKVVSKMFGKLKNLFGGDSGIEITAPVAGKVVALEDVPDPTFAQGILGPGIAIEPAEGRIVAPADGTVDVMNMAWGGICAENMVSLNISEGHKTSENIKKRGAFTLSIADIPHIKEADFLGTASGNTMPDKFERSGLTAVKSEKVDAPVVQEFPITLECKVVEDKTEVYGHHVIGEIVGVLADESVLDESGRVDPSKLNAFVFDQFQNGYYAIGEKLGLAWNIGKEFLKK